MEYMVTLAALLGRGAPLLADGAMGTELFARGLTAGDPPEPWNLDRAEDIVDVHNRYVEAGADIILTNSFGANAFRLRLHDLHRQVLELNEAAARNGRFAAESAVRPVVVAGSIGPTGELLAPLGTMTPDTAASAFADQARGLATGGADLLWIETMSSLEEIEAAVAGARSACALPIAITLSFDTAGRTMMGVSAEAAAERLARLDPAAIGANCGNGIAQSEAAVLALEAAVLALEAMSPRVPIVVKTNAGIPEVIGERLHYAGTPEVMGAHAERMARAGVDIIGGCCGTSPRHIAYMRGVLDGTIVPPGIDPPDPETAAATAAPTPAPAHDPADRRRRRARQGRP